MNFPTSINWTNPFPILGVFGGIFLLFSKFQLKILYTNSEDPDQAPHYAVSDLDLHCLHMSHKKDARLKWVNLLRT